MVTEHSEPALPPKPTEDNPESRAASEYGPSIIGATLVMRGELLLDEDLTIDGTFDGTIIDGAKNLKIGTFAQVKARIKGESADIAGEVDGDFDGSGTVVLHRTARINGAISADSVRIEDGTNLEHAILSGRISRAEDN